MSRVVTVLVPQKATKTQIIVLAIIAAYEVAFICFIAASVAHRLVISMASHIRGLRVISRVRNSSSQVDSIFNNLLRNSRSSSNTVRCQLRRGRCLLHLGLARRNGLSRAVCYHAINDRTLDQPVTFTKARSTVDDTSSAEVIVTTFANTAVIMFIWNRPTTVVAVNAEHPTRGVV